MALGPGPRGGAWELLRIARHLYGPHDRWLYDLRGGEFRELPVEQTGFAGEVDATRKEAAP